MWARELSDLQVLLYVNGADDFRRDFLSLPSTSTSTTAAPTPEESEDHFTPEEWEGHFDDGSEEHVGMRSGKGKGGRIGKSGKGRRRNQADRAIASRTPQARRPAELAVGSFVASFYKNQVQVFESREAALQHVECGIKCLSHCGRVAKRDGSLTFLRCRLRDIQPSCPWMAMPQVMSDNTAVLWQLPSQGTTHNSKSAASGERGAANLAEHKEIVDMFEQFANGISGWRVCCKNATRGGNK